ncbi:MAG: hypothetical protein HY847_02290 [Betaproteobacteria bacterium]|nr:hypothetical protein [Betaproteobacteria bacterium]
MKFGDSLWKRVKAFDVGSSLTSPPLAEARFFLLDVDVTGVNIRRDRAIGIAILPFDSGRFRVSDIVWTPLALSDEGGKESSWRDSYAEMVESIAASPVITYNPRFVRHMIKHIADEHDLSLPYGSEWIDLAAILDGAIGREAGEDASLHSWQRRLDIEVREGHSAIADVFAMAQLLEVAFGYCEDLRIATLD